MRSGLLFAAALCAAAALAEAIAAGRGIRARFKEIRFPRWSIPLAVWPLVGLLYYAMCFVTAYRLYMMGAGPARNVALGMLVTVMAVNAAWNVFFFRAKDLRLAFLISLPYGLLAILLFAVLWSVDRPAAILVGIYLAYLVYAGWWGYKLWKLNR